MNNDLKKAVRRFMQALQKQDWTTMSEACQLTWRADGHPGVTAEEWLEARYSDTAFDTYRVDGCVRAGRHAHDVTVWMKRKAERRGRTMTLRAVRELGPYKPHLKGTWGVNPASGLKGGDDGQHGGINSSTANTEKADR